MDLLVNKAKEMLIQENYTCVIINNKNIYTSRDRGVKPLLDWYGTVNLQGASAADKVVGKAAAFLYVFLKVKEVYAGVISEPAYKVLLDYNINVTYDKKVKAIQNRDKTGFCPMETAVWNINNPNNAYNAIIETRKKLMNK